MSDLTRPEPNAPPSAVSSTSPQPLTVWIASADQLRDGLSAEPMTARQIAAHLGALRAAGVGYWEPMTEDEWTIALSTWKRALSSCPAPFVAEAFEYWTRTMSRRPSPGDIANRAHQQAGEAAKILRSTAQPAPAPFATGEPDEAEIERRRQIAERLAADFPILRRAPR